MLTHEQLKPLADAVDPVLALIAIIAPFSVPPVARFSRVQYFICLGLSLAIMYVIRALDHSQFGIWPTMGLHFSSHTGFAVVMLVALAYWQRWFAIFGIVILVCYGALLIYQHYHSLGDILSSAFVIALITAVIYWCSGRAKPSVQSLGRFF